jgi:hypothetical protein
MGTGTDRVGTGAFARSAKRSEAHATTNLARTSRSPHLPLLLK